MRRGYRDPNVAAAADHVCRYRRRWPCRLRPVASQCQWRLRQSQAIIIVIMLIEITLLHLACVCDIQELSGAGRAILSYLLSFVASAAADH